MLLPVNLTLTPQRLARGRASLRCSSRFLTRILAGSSQCAAAWVGGREDRRQSIRSTESVASGRDGELRRVGIRFYSA
jgi:hypothetical protein